MMIYVRCRFGYSARFNEREQRLMHQASLNLLTFNAEGELAHRSPATIPWNLAKLLAKDADITVAEIFTEEEVRMWASTFEDKIIINERTQGAAPSDAVMRVNEVQVLEDCCTYTLQEQLDSGWQILAICPQPQRRPDYVMGRIPKKLPNPKPEPTTEKSNDIDDSIPF